MENIHLDLEAWGRLNSGWKKPQVVELVLESLSLTRHIIWIWNWMIYSKPALVTGEVVITRKLWFYEINRDIFVERNGKEAYEWASKQACLESMLGLHDWVMSLFMFYFQHLLVMVWLEMLRPLFLRCLLIWVTFVGHWSVQGWLRTQCMT